MRAGSVQSSNPLNCQNLMPNGINFTKTEGVGFEPTGPVRSMAFQAIPFGRSGTLPMINFKRSSAARP